MYTMREMHPGYLTGEQYVIEQVKAKDDRTDEWLILDAVTGEELNRVDDRKAAIREIEYLVGEGVKVIEARIKIGNCYYRVCDNWNKHAISQQQRSTQQRHRQERGPARKRPQPGKPQPTTKKPAGKLKKFFLKLMNFPDEAITEAALRPTDKKVVDAFLDQRPAEGRILISTGEELEQLGMGGEIIARWVEDRIVILPETDGQTSTRTEESIIRYLRKKTPANWLTAAAEYQIDAACIADLYGMSAASKQILTLRKTKAGWTVNGEVAPMSDGEAQYLIKECGQ